MAYDFPNSPVVNQVYGNYFWDGEKWLFGVPTGSADLQRAPFDAMAYSGMQVNGSGDVSQELGLTGATLVSGAIRYIADNWQGFYSCATGVVVGAQFAQASFPAPLPGYFNSAGLVATTALSSLANGDQAVLRTYIEGYRVAKLMWGTANAQPLSYGAQIYSTNPGTCFVRIINGNSNRSYYREHVLVAGWNWVSATIPGDTTGTWTADSTAGLIIDIFAAGRSATPATPNVWSAVITGQTTGSTQNLLSTTGSAFYVTGFIVLPGIELPSSARAPFIMRPYDEELQICQRYLQAPLTGSNYGVPGFCAAATVARTSIPLRRVMRSAPTLLVQAIGSVVINTPSVNVAATAAAMLTAGPGGVGVDFTTSGMTAGQACTVGVQAGTVLFSARY